MQLVVERLWSVMQKAEYFAVKHSSAFFPLPCSCMVEELLVKESWVDLVGEEVNL